MNRMMINTAIASILVSATPAMADTQLLVTCVFPPQHFVCREALPRWMEQVERETEGRVTAVLTPTTVAPAPDILAAVERGVADVGIQFNGLIQDQVTGPLVSMIPFTGTRNAEATGVAVWEFTQEHFADEFDTVHLLSQFVALPSELYSLRDRPITSVDDFTGLRLWALAGVLADFARETGAGVVATPAVQSNEIIGRGVVDAAMGPDPIAAAQFQLIPYIRSVTLFSKGLSNSSFSFFMNKDTWSSIDEEDQAAITRVSGETFARETSRLWDEAVVGILDQMQASGIEFIDAPSDFDAQMIAMSDGIRNQWIEAANAKGLDGAALLEEFQNRVEELSAD